MNQPTQESDIAKGRDGGIPAEIRGQRQAPDSIIRYAPGGVFVYSAEKDEKFSFVSDNMLAMLGYTREEFREKFDNRFSRMIYGEDRERTLQTIWEQIAVGPFDTCFYRIERKDGSLIWVHDEGHIVTDERGKRWFYVVIVDITDSVRTREDLAGQNNELRQLIDRLPVQIVVYQAVEGVVHAVAANGYLNRHTDLAPARLLKMNGPELTELIFPEDRPAAVRFFHDLFGSPDAPAELIYRTTLSAGTNYHWYRCNATRVIQEDGSVLVYAVYTDASYQKEKEADFQRVIQELLTANPDALCTFRLNLTRNLCSDCHGASEYTRQLLDSRTADELLEKLASMVDGRQERDDFCRLYSRSGLLNSFYDGRDKFAATYRRLTEKRAQWVTTYWHTLKNPYTGEIEVVAYSLDTDHAHKEKAIIASITSEEYDCYGLIDAGTRSLSYYYISPACEAAGSRPPDQYDLRVRALSETLSSPRERFLQEMAFETVLDALRTRAVYTCAYSCLDGNGDKRRKQVSFRWLESDRREIMFSRSDITDAFRREESYAEQLRSTMLEAERANEMKSDFLGNVSHDMRTPLNAILGYDRLAQQAEGLTPEVREFLLKIENAGDTLLSLINDTLDLQKIETGAIRLKPQPVSCEAVIRDVVTAVQPLMEKKNIRFVLDNSRAVMATINVDLLRVREIFINLLSNAIKFTPAGGRIDLIVECVGLEERLVRDRIVVRDTGCGMSRDFLQRMYEPFAQERNEATADIGGSGLGLAIVKRSVELMGGRIEARSEPGQGTEFSVWLDFERLDDGRAGTKKAAGAPASIAGLRILLCEDNEMNTEIARRVLEMNGAEVTTARNGREGVQTFRDSDAARFDAVLMDIRMPVLDGYGAARQIRASSHPRAKTIPILAMSADAYASDVEKTLGSGMNGHLAKPIDPPKLIGEIARLVGEERGGAPAESAKNS